LNFPITDSRLERLGWDDGWEATFAEHRAAGLIPARVAVQHRGAYDLAHAQDSIRASAAARLAREDRLPAVGDWVGLDPETMLVEAVLPRRTVLSRKEALHATREQVLAANVDVAFLMQSLPLDFNVRRLERYLAMAWESGAQPVVLLTKIDLVVDHSSYLAEAETITFGSCPVHPLSARTGEGLDDVRAWFKGNRTAVLIGSSGVGKSTLVNALAGAELLETREVREDDQRGRHTTTRRELVVLPDGGVVLDTPGIRELQLWDADLEQAFGDVEEIVLRCRFADCAHRSEPGCAIRDALLDGSLSSERWTSYRKLQREQRALEVRRDHLLRREQLREYKIRARQQRSKRR
jgi:ribosome biogenesis GTPase / thiamine phosphate phosphatase